jgi:Patatin-like phospholipase
VSADRARQAAPTPPAAGPPATDNLVGLAMSGGGIRSATFGLGALQALHKLGLLAIFDYVSTVSGGGFTGAWWSAWLSRAARTPRGLFPEAEDIEPSRRPSVLLTTGESSKPSEETRAARDPIHHLRLFANYLTPRRGALSADTWRAFHRCAGERRAHDHSITWSARRSSEWGIVKPSALAVLRLITRRNRLGRSMGKSPTLAPLRILSM